MRVFNFYYLKILLICAISLLCSDTSLVSGGTVISKASNLIYKQILKLRTLPFEDCGSTYDILYLNISSCNSIPCEMKRGSVVDVNVIFDDNGKNTSFLKHRVRWIFNAVKTNAQIRPDPCDGDHQCIITNNEGKSYQAQVMVNDYLPVMRGSMLWEAVDGNDDDVICFKVPVTLIV